ncbi:7-carboxy-7-deazaguanine synthase QueE [Sulfurimonas sp.]|jgi:organic radical activating enzyme|uniref:7-carboxy-7-deazaguanine synthase QueE n=1 Tax=Sulfurimonas sp. TaxID=2022749 RepID=UPI0025E88E52|nr:7-carboxy-7-deazaguanine synthase QueE [Sulfurimonas sp.]MCK9472093.1 7-carboxy-7-deazaguanine synthase QueE [Sulfurimonas sp.]MDD3506682.1 7-carboxy-7-deazaguanine synthase QueE [Sulfurimonas sp.]
MIYLVEHFYSIQGEGRYTGTPSIFFRFGGCNMKCEGFGCQERAPDGTKILGCDTVYAVNKEHFLQNWIPIKSVKELLGVLDLYELPKKVDIVLTGGEPLIYASEHIFIEFLEALHAAGHRITFETNGSLGVDFERYPIYKECIFALSVKLSNSNEPLSKRVRGSVINSIATNAKEAFFKFSIDAESINLGLEEEIEEIIIHSPTTSLYCMPLGGTKEEVEANTAPLIEFCKSKGYNFSDRLHIRIWDQNRGV